MNYSCKAHKTEINVKAPGFSLFSQYLTPLCEVVCLLWKINWINTTVKLPVDLSITFRFSLSRESSVNSVNPQKCPGGASRGWRILLAVESITIFIYQAFCGFTSAVRIAFKPATWAELNWGARRITAMEEQHLQSFWQQSVSSQHAFSHLLYNTNTSTTEQWTAASWNKNPRCFYHQDYDS